MNSFRIFRLWMLWQLFGWPSVILIDFDHEMNARLVRGPSRFPHARRWCFINRTVRLDADGKVQGPCYVERWEPLYGCPLTRHEGGSR